MSDKHEAAPLIGMHVRVAWCAMGVVSSIDGTELVVTSLGHEIARVPQYTWRKWLASMGRAKVTLPKESP